MGTPRPGGDSASEPSRCLSADAPASEELDASRVRTDDLAQLAALLKERNATGRRTLEVIRGPIVWACGGWISCRISAGSGPFGCGRGVVSRGEGAIVRCRW